MGISEKDRRIQEAVCGPCRNDRYNHPGIEDGGALVTSEKCKLIPHVKYDRETNKYICLYRIPRGQRLNNIAS